jgi:GNAT superfamily N-acetyltransferase
VDEEITTAEFEFHPLTADRWPDVVRLFDTHSNPRSCWCQYWRLAQPEWRSNSPEQRRDLLEGAVEAGAPVGVLAYRDGEPVGWCSVAPRETHDRVQRTRSMRASEPTTNTWSVVCFFVHRSARHRFLMTELLKAAVEYARERGAGAVEGYPVVRRLREDGSPIGAPFRFMGSLGTYRRAGFADVTPNAGQTRHLMRRRLT